MRFSRAIATGLSLTCFLYAASAFAQSSDDALNDLLRALGQAAPTSTSSTLLAPPEASPPPAATSAATSSTSTQSLDPNSPAYIAAVNNLKALIAALAQRIVEIIAERARVVSVVATTTAETVSTSSAQTFCPPITRLLKIGSRGADVLCLQQFLIYEHMLAAELASGYFGGNTEQAVKYYQSSNDIITFGTPQTTGYGAVGPKTRAAINARFIEIGAVDFQSNYATSSASLTTVSASSSECVLDGTHISSGDSGNFYTSRQVDVGGVCLAIPRTCYAGVLSGSHDAQYSQCIVSSGTIATSTCSFAGQTVLSGDTVTGYQSPSVLPGTQCVSELRTCNSGSLSGTYNYRSCGINAAQDCNFNGLVVSDGFSVNAYQNSSVPYGQFCVSEARWCSNGTLFGSYANASCSVGAAVAPTCTLTASSTPGVTNQYQLGWTSQYANSASLDDGTNHYDVATADFFGTDMAATWTLSVLGEGGGGSCQTLVQPGI